MTLQLLLSMAVAIGILTLAVIALMNVAGVRLHELHAKMVDKPSSRPSFAYTYSKDRAEKVRRGFRRLPFAFGCAATIATAAVACAIWLAPPLTAEGEPKRPNAVPTATSAKLTADAHAGRDTSHMQPLGIALLAATTAYVLLMIAIATFLSRRLYAAMQSTFETGPQPSPESLAAAT